MSTVTLPPGTPALLTLTRRELVRFLRQPSRIVAAIGTPLIIWIFFGGGFAGSYIRPGAEGPGTSAASYAGFLLPGMASLTVMFSSIFAAISLIEDRHAGFLQSVLVSPAPRWSVIGAKVAGGTILAAAQGFVLLLLAPVLGMHNTFAGFWLAVLALVLISVGINGLGLAAAWRIDSTQGFHGVMNLVLMPMWLLSGSLFPAAGAAVWLRVIMWVNPLYWPTAALRHALSPELAQEAVPAGVVWVLAFLGAAAGFVLAWGTVGRVRRGAGAATPGVSA